MENVFAHSFKSVVVILTLIFLFCLGFGYVLGQTVSQSRHTPLLSPLPSPLPANAAFEKASTLCGSRGIFDLTWADYPAGKIKSLYCN